MGGMPSPSSLTGDTGEGRGATTGTSSSFLKSSSSAAAAPPSSFANTKGEDEGGEEALQTRKSFLDDLSIDWQSAGSKLGLSFYFCFTSVLPNSFYSLAHVMSSVIVCMSSSTFFIEESLADLLQIEKRSSVGMRKGGMSTLLSLIQRNTLRSPGSGKTKRDLVCLSIYF